MPHIHTAPNQHDMTVSGYILRQKQGEWECLVHWHKKIEVYMQIGGHIELEQTPWQAMAAELREETGFSLDEVEILQPSEMLPREYANISHPVPFAMSTYNVGDEHYHSDMCFAFVANNLPTGSVAEGESNKLRWVTLNELSELASNGEALQDVAYTYEYLLQHIDQMKRVATSSFSLKKPERTGLVYKRGSAAEQRG